MGINLTPDKMRGFLIPTANITKSNIWSAQSTFTQMNSRAGVAKASQPYTGLTLSMAGEQSQDITVETVEGGTPGEKASFVWSGTDAVKLGQCANNVVTDWKYIAFGSITNTFADHAAIGTDDGTLYWLQELDNGVIYSLSLRRQKKDGAIETLQTLKTSTTTSTNTTAKPAIAQLKDGSLIVTFFDYTTTNQVNLFVWRSYDNGDNWTEVSKRALIDSYIDVGPTQYTIDTTTLIVSDDILTLVVGLRSRITPVGANKMVQFVSRDSGITFFSLGNYGEDHAFPVGCALPDGQIAFAYVSATTKLSFIKIPQPGIAAATTAYTSEYQVDISSGAKTWATASGTTLLNGNVCMWYQDGKIFVVARDTSYDMYGFESSDLGETWQFISQTNTPGISSSLVFYGRSSTVISNIKAVKWEGRTILMANTNNSIVGLYLGGWSSVQPAALVSQPDRNQYVGYEANWVHNQLPGTSVHFTASGTGTQTLLLDGLRIITANTVRQYQYTGSIYSQQFYRFKMKVTNGTLMTQDYITFKVENTDGTNSYTLKLRFSTTSFRIYDHNTQLASVLIPLTSIHEFMVFQDGTAVKVYHREWDEKQAKKWTETAVTLGTQAPGLTGRLYFGHLTLTSTTFQSYWSEMHIGLGGFGQPNDDLRGATYPAYGLYQYIDEGLLLSAKDSPARAEDQYTISPRYDYPIEHIFHEVALSPKVVWRSIDSTSLQRIAFFMDPVVQATARSFGLSDVGGIHLSNINWKTASLKVWNGSTWSTLASIDTSTGMTGSFIRRGATLISNSPNKDFYLKYNEANGWHAELVSSGTTKIVKIKQNSEGLFSNSPDAKPCILLIDTELTDPSTLPATGTISLMPTSVTLIAELFQAKVTNPGEYAYALEIPVQETLQGYFQIGTMVFGNMYFMSPQYQRGRTISYDTNVQSYTTNDGQYYARKMSDGRRSFRVAWTEPVDTTRIHELNPDYWEYSNNVNAQAVSHYGDAIFGMMGITQYLSEQKPVVYLPAIKTNATTELFNRYHNHALVRVNGGVSMESVLGEEEENELFRLSTVGLIEVE